MNKDEGAYTLNRIFDQLITKGRHTASYKTACQADFTASLNEQALDRDRNISSEYISLVSNWI